MVQVGGCYMAALLTLSQLLAPVEGLSAGAVLLRTPSSLLHSCWARQGRGREGGQRRGKVGTGDMRMGGEIAAFAEGLRILSMREQRELLEKLQNANNDPAAPWKDTAPSWDALALRLEKKGKEQSTLLSTARVRLFDALDGTVPRVTLYRDSSSWCPYCQKVWLMLEEKRVPFSIEKINMRCYGDKPEWFKKLNPSGNIPVVKIDDAVIVESNAILTAIEETFSSPDYRAMLPEVNDPHAARVPALLELEREIFNHWMRWLVRESAYGDEMMMTFIDLLNQADKQLEEAQEVERRKGYTGPVFFLGSDVSMVDCMFAPFLERMAASVPYYKGLPVRGNRKWPHLQQWYTAMDTREAYRGIQSDYYTHCHGLPPQIGSCESHAEAKPFQEAIDGSDGLHWNLPLPPIDEEKLSQGYQPVLINDEEARCEAAARILDNRDGIVRFCLRALGERGRVLGCMLADPDNTPDMRFQAHMDSALRHVVAAMLRDDGAVGGVCVEGAGLPVETVGAGLAYLRERISVPRDMSWAAARQFRAHLTAVMKAVQREASAAAV